MLDARIVPTPRGGYNIEELDGETLLYRDVGKRAIYLNETAAAIWRLCDGERTLQAIVDILVEAYPDQHTDIAGDVSEAIDTLVREGALKLVAPDNM